MFITGAPILSSFDLGEGIHKEKLCRFILSSRRLPLQPRVTTFSHDYIAGLNESSLMSWWERRVSA